MEKIYHETTEKSGRCLTGNPCVQVRVYIPTPAEDYDLPALTILEGGKVNSNGYLCYTDKVYTTVSDRNHDKPFLIRLAIQLFDNLKEQLWKETPVA